MIKKILVCILLILLVFSFGCKKKTDKDEEKAYVKVSKVSQGTLSEYIRFTGDIHGEDEATVYPKFTGKLLRNTVKMGDYVRKGQTIALVDRDEVGYTFNEAPIVAPLTGVVGKTYLDRGAMVAPETPIALIADIGQIKVKINISEKDLGYIKTGQTAKVTIDTYPKEGFIGRISTISPVLDPMTRTCPAEIIMVNPAHRLKPGMFAHVEMKKLEKRNVFYAVQEAILTEGMAKYIFIAKDGKAKKRKVVTGLRENNKIEIVSGVIGNEEIVTVGKEKLKHGSVIEIID